MSRMTNLEAKAILKSNKPTSDPRECGKELCTAVDIAIEALEKQIPKKPIKSDREIRYCEVWECPSCGFEWSSRVVDFCYKCGQRINWSEA